MTQPIDYEPPKRGGKPPASVGMFLVGLLVGVVATVGLAAGGLMFASGAFALITLCAAPVVVLSAGILLIVTRQRSMGQGILTAVPLTVLAAFVLCGLALRNI